jgi:hypothetical protein
VHVRLERGDGRLAALLGQVHGHVGRAQQVLPCSTSLLVAMPMLRLTLTSMSPSSSGRATGHQQALGECLRALGAGGVQDDDELVAPQPPGQVVDAHLARDAPGDLHEQQVTRGVPEAVVDELEVVDVQEQDARERAGRRGGQPFVEQGPVRQARSAGRAEPGATGSRTAAGAPADCGAARRCRP